MNKRRKSKILLAVCLMASMMFLQVSQAVTAVAADEVKNQVPIVTNYEEFAQAVLSAKDGDVIVIAGMIYIPANVDVGTADKHLVFNRMDMSANVYTGLEVQAATVNVRNITFDGNNVAIESFFIATGNVNFENVTFHNCITPYGGGAVQLRGGNYQFNNCTFSNNQASIGGHISGNSDCTISIKIV